MDTPPKTPSSFIRYPTGQYTPCSYPSYALPTDVTTRRDLGTGALTNVPSVAALPDEQGTRSGIAGRWTATPASSSRPAVADVRPPTSADLFRRRRDTGAQRGALLDTSTRTMDNRPTGFQLFDEHESGMSKRLHDELEQSDSDFDTSAEANRYANYDHPTPNLSVISSRSTRGRGALAYLGRRASPNHVRDSDKFGSDSVKPVHQTGGSRFYHGDPDVHRSAKPSVRWLDDVAAQSNKQGDDDSVASD